jgi:protease IV
MEGLKQLFLPITATITFIQKNFKAILLVLIIAVIFWPKHSSQAGNYNLETISLIGPIKDAGAIVTKIDQARKNKNVKGVLLIINSPGGAVAPSVEISYAVKRLRATKPVVAYASGTMASGSYYSGVWANKIIANPGSIIGSIGVIMEGYDLSGIMKKLGISTQIVDAGKFKQLGTPDREWLPYEKAELNKVIQGTYNMFVTDVAHARKLRIANAPKFANAHIFTAYQAKQIGLIDQVGVIYNAKQMLIRLAHVRHPVWNRQSKFSKFVKSFMTQASITLYTFFPQITLK